MRRKRFSPCASVLRFRIEGREAVRALSHPAFARAMEEARKKLRTGKARWYSFDEVFDD
jgi:hypothetical protein